MLYEGICEYRKVVVHSSSVVIWSWDLINSIVGWNSLSRAGKLSPERDFFKDLKNPPAGGLPQSGRKMLSDSESTKYTHTPSRRRYLESRL